MAGAATIRRPAAAGTFYPADGPGLERALDACFSSAGQTRSGPQPIALVCPHAGYIYSGSAAAAAYQAIPPDTTLDTVAILGPNHTGLGTPISVSSAQQWECVGHAYAVDDESSAAFLERCPSAARESMAHVAEHSLEVQLPFLSRRLKEGFRILPIAIGLAPDEEGLAECRDLGQALAEALRGRSALLIASTDMSHYVSQQTARRQDAYAMEAIEQMDPAGLVRAVREHGISMCGVMPTAAVLEAAIRMGATSARLAAYTTSGDVTGDTGSVVSYASFVVT